MEAGLKSVDVEATPEATSRAFAEAVATRDAEAAAAYMSVEGCLLTPDGTEVRGRAQVREVLAQLTVTHPHLHVEAGRVITAGAVAVASQRWWISSKGAGRGPFKQDLAATLILARHAEAWQVTVVAPWGI